MIDIHLVSDGYVEPTENQRLGYMPAEIGAPSAIGTGRAPQPSSAGLNSAAHPSAKVGMRSRLKAVAWSLYTRTMSGVLLDIHSLVALTPGKLQPHG